MVERHLAKVNVASSNLVFRFWSKVFLLLFLFLKTGQELLSCPAFLINPIQKENFEDCLFAAFRGTNRLDCYSKKRRRILILRAFENSDIDDFTLRRAYPSYDIPLAHRRCLQDFPTIYSSL